MLRWLVDGVLWPGGVYFTPGVPRTVSQQHDTRLQCWRIMRANAPALVLVSSTDAVDKLHSMLQFPAVLRSLALTLLDLLLKRLFPNITVKGLQHRPPEAYTFYSQ